MVLIKLQDFISAKKHQVSQFANLHARKN